jgi:hypothetical protein
MLYELTEQAKYVEAIKTVLKVITPSIPPSNHSCCRIVYTHTHTPYTHTHTHAHTHTHTHTLGQFVDRALVSICAKLRNSQNDR